MCPGAYHNKIVGDADAEATDGRIQVVLEEFQQMHNLSLSLVRRGGSKLNHVGHLSRSILALRKYKFVCISKIEKYSLTFGSVFQKVSLKIK